VRVASDPYLIQQVIDSSSSLKIDLTYVTDSRYDVVQRYSGEGKFQETWCICEGLERRTVFMGPGAILLAAEAPEERWGWQVGQWRRTWRSGHREWPWPWTDGAHAAIPAATVLASMPPTLEVWVVEATQAGVMLVERELDCAPPEEQAFLHRRLRMLTAELSVISGVARMPDHY
jgi:hypothetical protein